MSNFNPIIRVTDDGNITQDVGEWAEEKYKLVGMYCDIFTTSMHQKWKNLAYIDLFSGCGYSKIRGSSKIIKSSPLIAISIPIHFSKYIFCEENKEKIKVLQKRAESESSDFKVAFIEGDSNQNLSKIITQLPKYTKENTLLTFCFVDPFAMSNLCFRTIESLAFYRMDFLVLLPLGMDANRNFEYYLRTKNNIVENFIGFKNWREEFREKYTLNNSSFIMYISNKFTSNMINLGYKRPESFHEIRSHGKNLPLYHLAFFSKDPLGNKFWREVKKYSTIQENLF